MKRDIEQNITSSDRIDEWFELKTKGLTDFAKAELKQRWGTIKKCSAANRDWKIVMDIMLIWSVRTTAKRQRKRPAGFG